MICIMISIFHVLFSLVKTSIIYIRLGVFFYLKPIICPRAEFHVTGLLIEWEVGDIYFARTLKFCGNWPKHVAVVTDHGVGRHYTVRVLGGADKKNVTK